ncbi:hypothetical protein BV20DRAFT_330785 [Pilatotrama ljubarskyi]|nr:hypothetical protein BV20DRAFT_330785 [Pilatotrama ljubarskyi]
MPSWIRERTGREQTLCLEDACPPRLRHLYRRASLPAEVLFSILCQHNFLACYLPDAPIPRLAAFTAQHTAMTSKKKGRKPDRFDVQGSGLLTIMFDRSCLQDEVAIEHALADFERLLYGSISDASDMIGELQSVPFLLEFILCTVRDHAFETLKNAFMQAFPSVANKYIHSIHRSVLARICTSLLLPYERIADAPSQVVTIRRFVEDGIAVLQAISTLRFADTAAEDADTGQDPKRLAKRKAQTRRRSSAASALSPILDRAPFLDYGVEPPSTGEEALALTAQLLQEQRESLQRCFEFFRKEPNLSFFRAAYLRVSPGEEASHPEEGVTDAAALPAQTDLSRDCRPATALPGRSMDLKATLYLDGIEQYGEWPIYTSTRAQRDLRKARNEDGRKFKIILKKIQELSRGHFSNDNHKMLTGPNLGIPVYEAKMSRDLRLVPSHKVPYSLRSRLRRRCRASRNVKSLDRFHIAIILTRLCRPRTVIRIFGIYTHAQLDGRFWDAVSRMLECQGNEYKKRCVFRNRPTHRRGDNVVLPARFPMLTSHEQVAASASASSLFELSKEQSEEMRSLILEGYVSFSRAFLNSILADQDVAHVFSVSQREKEIIEHSGSCIVKGRSGTGKTTTMLFKMLGIERSWGAMGEGMTKPRQLFVTQSRVLAEKVEDYYRKLQQSLTTAGCSHTELKEMAAKGSMQRRQRLVDADEEVFWRADLPKRYGALEDDHFPMFLTYDHLCRLLENEFDNLLCEANKRRRAGETLRGVLRSSKTPDQTDGMISDKTFLGTYWFHFPQSLTKSLNPDLVFSEFLGVIQGSNEALNSEKGHLDRDTYCRRGHRSLISDADQREAIYELYLAYRKKKKQLWQRDAADRTYELVNALKEERFPGRPVDFLYVDEAQDNLLTDTYVLRALCPNPHGMFWAGDTAQTIAAGSAFRFSELKAFLHQASAASGAPAPPSLTMFDLTTNYRSHSGIVNCAAAIVELITRFWPDSVDRLPQERGMTVGPKPTFFWHQSTTGCRQFLADDSGSTAEFGARQCILVRTEATRDRLRSQFGEVGIILTVPESKGLEFDDVLLYNPFEDSSMDYQQWRIVLDGIPGHIAPALDNARHSGICRELKFLYVAVTRARMNLWIVDGSNAGEPMRRLLTHAELIDNHDPGTPMPRLAVTSGRDEWEEVAWSLFQKHQYSEAELAFERAGLRRQKQVAHAYSLREQALSAPAGSGINGRRLALQADRFAAVADAFTQSAEEAVGADDKQSYHRIAGEYYARAGNDHKAGAAFYLAGHYESAAKHYRAAGMFEEAVDVVQRHKEDVSTPVSEGIISVARLQFLRTNEVGKARTLFRSEEEALAYMADYHLESPRASLLESLRRFSDAAECHLAEGATLEAIRLFMLDGHCDPASFTRAAQTIVDELWRGGLSPITELVRSRDFSEDVRSGAFNSQLLQLVNKFRGLPVKECVRDEMAMFEAISRHDLVHLRELSDKFSSAKNLAAHFLCLHSIFSEPLQLESSDLSETVNRLTTFLSYARTLQRFSCHPDPCSSPAIQRLFSFSVSDDEHYLLHYRSSLCSRINQPRPDSGARGEGQDIPILRQELEHLVKTVLREHLLEKVCKENEVCHTQLRSIRPCLLHATSGRCPLRDCPQYHAAPGSDGTATYNILVQIHILQIMIYHTLYAADIPSRTLFEQQRVWLRRFYEALYPAHYKLGTLPQLSGELIPELQQGRNIIRVWVTDFLNTLNPADIPFRAFLSNLLRATRLAMLFDHTVASNGLPRIPCMQPRGRIRPALWRGSAYVVWDLVYMMQSKAPDALDRGVSFLNHILCTRLAVDIGVLCDFMDHLCGSLIIAARLGSGGTGTLHDVTLPRSWIMSAVNGMSGLQNKSTQRAVEYTRHLKDLLLQVYTGENTGASKRGHTWRHSRDHPPYLHVEWHVLFESIDLSRPGSYLRTRNVFVARICRNLCLWGYNLRSPPLRQNILAIISAIGQFDLVLSPAISPYLYAMSWDGLARAVRASTTGSALDEMLQLWHSSIPNLDRGLPNVRRIRFTRPEDLPALLNVKDPFISDSAPLHPTTLVADSEAGLWSPVPSSHSRAPEWNPPSGEDDVPLSSQSPGDVSEMDDVILGEHTAAAQADRDPVDDSAVPSFSAREISAATKIADVFRQYWARAQAKRDALEEMRRRIYTQFHGQAQRKVWSTPLCRILFLGVLPHAYLVVECVRNHLSGAKADAQQRLKTVDHRQLEHMQSTVDQLAILLEEALRLYEEVHPTATIYDDCHVATIKACVCRTHAFVAEVETAMGANFEWRDEIDFAMRIISGPLAA